MRDYHTRDQARNLVRENPNKFLGNIDEKPVVDVFADAGVLSITGQQIELYQSKHPILAHLGGRALRVLDIAPWYDPLGLYIASRGHNVTAIDIDSGSVEWQNNASKKMELDNFEAYQGDAHDLNTEPKYDLVIAGMLLHFLDKAKAQDVTARIQAATVPGGLNAVSVYTIDNPDRELNRGLVNLYNSVDELADAYNTTGWQVLESYEGPRAHATDRGGMIGPSMVLLPSIAEVIARKTPAAQFKIPDFSDIDDFERYAID